MLREAPSPRRAGDHEEHVRRELQLGVQQAFAFGDKRGEIATLDIAGDQQAAQRALMLNNKSANNGLYGGELAPRQPYSARVLPEQRANRLRSPATYRIQQDVYVEDTVVLAKLFRWLTW